MSAGFADVRWIAEILEIPGALAYGENRWDAISRVETLALRIGWRIKRQSGTSHKVLSRPGWRSDHFSLSNP